MGCLFFEWLQKGAKTDLNWLFYFDCCPLVPGVEAYVPPNNYYHDVPLSLIVAYTSFLEWNSDPEIADAAEKLYGDIDYLELYVGLQAEEAKPLVDGAGLCPGKFFSMRLFFFLAYI